MNTSFRGAYVISMSQTEIDGQKAAPLGALQEGSVWRWTGEATRVGESMDVSRLERAYANQSLTQRAGRALRRFAGKPARHTTTYRTSDSATPERGFVLTDGTRAYAATLLEATQGGAGLIAFQTDLPPADKALRVVKASLKVLAQAQAQDRPGMICFADGTMIQTEQGARPVETLRPGDKVQTRDNGFQEILWAGSRHLNGARLYVAPHLRPIRIAMGALGADRPDGELLVSPDHRILIEGAPAQALFNTSEVLVQAGQLVNGSTVRVDRTLREVTYAHLLLPDHQIIMANGVPTESFHPASADPEALDASHREELFQGCPELREDPMSYGAYARRCLTAVESAILMQEAS